MVILIVLLIASTDSPSRSYELQEETTLAIDSIVQSSDSLITHQRAWSDNYYFKHNTDYTIEKSDFIASRNHRNKFDISSYTTDHNYWGQVYDSLYQFNKLTLKDLEDSLRIIGKQSNMKRHAFADLIVSFVQDIPYSYVLWSDSCKNKNDNKPCVDGEMYGILAPNEFLATLSGDCDTRTVTLYLLLKNLGFEPIIITSEKYAHAALALNLPVSGNGFMHKHKKYYFWETTNVGWELGMVPASYADFRYWEVALD